MPDGPQDAPSELSEGGTWLSYQEMAKQRRIILESVRRLVRRHRWRRQKGNDGTVRVLVPQGWADTSEAMGQDISSDVPKDSSSELARLAATFEAALAALRVAHEARLTELQERLLAAEMRAKAAEEQSAAELAEMRNRLEAAEKRADADAGDADVLRRAEMRRRAMGRWKRALATLLRDA